MGQVNIRGLVNTTYLREGERATVEHTDTIDQLAKRGFIKIEFAKGGYVPAPSGADAIPARIHDGEKFADAHGDVTTVSVVNEPPKSGRGASRAKWAEWLTLNGIDVSDDDTKNDLIEKWMGRAVQS